jgi:NAD(P)-dependent dehydrogenase (short-subunit alcohol dehydrogenase family)
MEVSQSSAARDVFSLSGRTAFVSGAAGHLGSAMVHALARAGAHVILNGRTAAKLEALRDQLAALGYEASIAAFDITDRPAAEQFLQGLDRLDVLVNNAVSGLYDREAPGDLAAFEGPLQSALVAPHGNIKAAMRGLEAAAAATGQASVINVASIFGHIAPMFPVFDGEAVPSSVEYAAAKGGMVQMTRYLACSLAPRKIRVNTLTPGIFPPKDIEVHLPNFAKRATTRTPLGRFGLAEEIGGPVVFLASDASSYMTGTDIRVDGGWTAW